MEESSFSANYIYDYLFPNLFSNYRKGKNLSRVIFAPIVEGISTAFFTSS